MSPTWYTPPEIARRLRVDPATVIGWLRSGELRGVDVAQRGSKRPRYRVAEADLEAFLNGRAASSPPPPPRRRRALPANVKRYV